MVAGHQGSKHQGRLNEMLILRQMLGRSPDRPKARVRNFIANARLGTKATTIHENVISPGVVVPLHTHVNRRSDRRSLRRGRVSNRERHASLQRRRCPDLSSGREALDQKSRDGAAAPALYLPSRSENAATRSGKRGPSGPNLQYMRAVSGPSPTTSQMLPTMRALHTGEDRLVLKKKLERAKGFEPSTPTLARSCSTPELHPHP